MGLPIFIVRFILRTLFVLLVVISPTHAFQGTSASAGQAKNVRIPAIHGDSTIAFVSDTQQPIFLERLAISGNDNEGATKRIFEDILGARPNVVVHLGDMVSLGFDSYAWELVDTFRTQLHRLRIPIFPTLGNHELMLYSKKGEEAFTDRFPYYKKTGYAIRIGALAIILLNSNLSKLSDAERASQRTWYDSTLAAMGTDSTVKMIAVGCHHSPYTNSTIVTPAYDIQKEYLPSFFASEKCRLFISGHAHASERFRVQEKDFLVIGGGGGLQQPLLTGKDQRWKDLSPLTTEKRMFHYVSGRLTATGLTLTVRMLKEDFSAFYGADSLIFRWQQ